MISGGGSGCSGSGVGAGNGGGAGQFSGSVGGGGSLGTLIAKISMTWMPEHVVCPPLARIRLEVGPVGSGLEPDAQRCVEEERVAHRLRADPRGLG